MVEMEDAIQEKHNVGRVLEVLEKLYAMAKTGDISAAKLYLDRVLGPSKVHAEVMLGIQPVSDRGMMITVPAEEDPPKLTSIPDRAGAE